MMNELGQVLRIAAPSDLAPNEEIVLEGQSRLSWTATTRLGFDYHSLREGIGDILEGEFGVKIDTDAQASLQCSLQSAFRTAVSLDSDGWLRVVVRKLGQNQLGFAARVSVGAQPSVPLPEKPDQLLAALLGVPDSHSLLDKALESFPGFRSLPRPVRLELANLFGTVDSEAAFAQLLEQLRPILALRDNIYKKAVTAVQKKYTTELSYTSDAVTTDAALIDCSFDFTGEGLSLFRQAVQGDYSGILAAEDPHVRLRQGHLVHGIRRETVLELHLPFLGKRQWRTRLSSFASLDVEAGEDGRLLVYSVDASDQMTAKGSYESALVLAGAVTVRRGQSSPRFTLTYSDTRKLPSAQAGTALAPVLSAYGFDSRVEPWLAELAAQTPPVDLEACLTLKIPGSLVTAWLDVAKERTMRFFEPFARVSVAVQSALRRWLPYVYFSDLDNFDTLDAAYPLLVYQASRPCPGKPMTEFAYDVMSAKSTALAYRGAREPLEAVLGRVQQRLLAAGRSKTAQFYAPRQAARIIASVQHDGRLMRSLLVADAFFVDELIKLAERGRRLTKQLQKPPETAVNELADYAASFVRTFHGKLKRLYGGREFVAFGTLLLVEATCALSAAQSGNNIPIQAILRISRPGQESALDQTFVNSAYQPAG